MTPVHTYNVACTIKCTRTFYYKILKNQPRHIFYFYQDFFGFYSYKVCFYPVFMIQYLPTQATVLGVTTHNIRCPWGHKKPLTFGWRAVNILNKPAIS